MFWLYLRCARLVDTDERAEPVGGIYTYSLMKEILRKNWTYILYEDNGQLLFSVVCGSVGLFDRNIILTEEEVLHYNKKKESYLDALSEQIRRNPERFQDRHVKL